MSREASAYPFAMRYRIRLIPRNPAPPVTRTFCCSNERRLLLHASPGQVRRITRTSAYCSMLGIPIVRLCYLTTSLPALFDDFFELALQCRKDFIGHSLALEGADELCGHLEGHV